MQNLLVDYLKLLLVLAGIVVLAYAALRYWLPKLSSLQYKASGPIQVIARMPLEPRKNLYVIKAGAEYLLIGTAENSVHMISALDAGAIAGFQTAAAAPAAPDFPAILRRLKRS